MLNKKCTQTLDLFDNLANFVSMKMVVHLCLVVFIAFLVTPTVISMVKKDADISLVYSFAEEEENHKSQKEIPAITNSDAFDMNFNMPKIASTITLFHSLKHDNVTSRIFSPPPERV